MIVLQKFGFKESKYERPQDAWICGRLADGNPCELGPGLDGQCCGTAACQPRLENGRWQCRRSANAGGPCQAGPFPDGRCCMALEPCVPRRSLRSKRGRLVAAATALMVGLIAFFLSGEEGRHFMTPGKLSSHHASLTDCSSCHSGAQSGQVDLMHRLMTVVEPRQNSNLCLTCHVMGREPFAPHTHPVEDLARRTEKLRLASKDWKPESLVQRIAFPATVKSRGAEAEIQCSTCHKEHQGVFANLKKVSNQRCQTCHVSRFGSFADSHPQFVKFPYQRRPRIAFDHQSHFGKYFPEATKAAIAGKIVPGNCFDCHQVGVRQRYMEVKSFGTMCSSCHQGDLDGATQVSGPKGIDVLVVPGLDVATLNERGIDIGNWPDKSEAVLTPFMKLLLDSEDHGVASGVAGLDLLDLRHASDQDLARVSKFAWAVKRLFSRLETTNPSGAKLLADDGFGMEIDQLQLAALSGGMSHDVIAAGNLEWFPGLKDELSRHARGEPSRDQGLGAKLTSMPKPSASPGANIASGRTAPGADILAGSASGKKDDILGSDNSVAPAKKDDILTKDDKGDALALPKQADILAEKKDDILSDQPSADGILAGPGDNGAKDNAANGAGVQTPDGATVQFDPEVWARTGGWYRQDFALRYRPTGHADQFLRTWLDFAGRGYGTVLHDEFAPIFDTLSPKDAVGRCTKCHSIDDQQGARLVNWLPFDPNALRNRFTNYSHKPHVELIGAKTCVKCHELQSAKSEFMKTYESNDPVNYTPNFKPLDKAVCASCHSQQTAWESCTLCHGYHVLQVSTKSPGQPLWDVLNGPTSPGKEASIPPSDVDTDASREYAMAEAIGTEQAWHTFVARHPSGRHHDLAVQKIAKLDAASVEQSPRTAVSSSTNTSDNNQTSDSPRAALEVSPNLQKAGAPDQPADTKAEASPASGQAAQAAPDPSMKAALSDQLAAFTNGSTPTPATMEVVAGDGEPTDADGFLRRGFDRAVRGDLDLARQDFDEVIRRDPNHAAALDNRCWVLALLDDVQAALNDCNASLRVAPNYADALDSRGLVNLKLGFYRKAIADYSAALSQFSGAKRAGALYGRGIAKRRSGNIAAGKSDIDAARSLKPTIVDEYASYGIR